MDQDSREGLGVRGGDEDHRARESAPAQEVSRHWPALLERVERGVAEINLIKELVARTLGGHGLCFRGGANSLEVTRAAFPATRLRVTNHEQSATAEWSVAADGPSNDGGEDVRARVSLTFATDSGDGLLLRKEIGTVMVMDEVVRYLLTPLLIPRP